jgi:hypothetical protein
VRCSSLCPGAEALCPGAEAAVGGAEDVEGPDLVTATAVPEFGGVGLIEPAVPGEPVKERVAPAVLLLPVVVGTAGEPVSTEALELIRLSDALPTAPVVPVLVLPKLEVGTALPVVVDEPPADEPAEDAVPLETFELTRLSTMEEPPLEPPRDTAELPEAPPEAPPELPPTACAKANDELSARTEASASAERSMLSPF